MHTKCMISSLLNGSEGHIEKIGISQEVNIAFNTELPSSEFVKSRCRKVGVRLCLSVAKIRAVQLRAATGAAPAPKPLCVLGATSGRSK